MKAVLYIVILEYSLYSKLSCCIRFIHSLFDLEFLQAVQFRKRGMGREMFQQF